MGERASVTGYRNERGRGILHSVEASCIKGVIYSFYVQCIRLSTSTLESSGFLYRC